VVETIMLKEGELAAPGMQVIQLVSLDKLKLYGDISERYLASIRTGDEVIVNFPDIGEAGLKVPIHRVGNVIDDKSRTFRIEVKIDNAKRRFKPNMYTTIRVNDFSSDAAFVVPAVIIKQDIQGNYLYVAERSGDASRARKRYVDLGLSYNDRTMIAGGLAAGEDVIVKGYTKVSDGVLVDVK
jgi:RND family efflux transporter MFP subunit